MDMKQLEDILFENPIIAAVKDDAGLEKALGTDCQIIFLLYGNICTVAGLVDRIKANNKLAVVHLDLIGGLSSEDVSVSFLREKTRADGIISTKAPLVKAAKEQGLLAIQRVFLIDSRALSNFYKYAESNVPDMIEILPAAMPKVIRKITTACRLPIIAGGLISDRDDVNQVLGNGARAVSSTNPEVWQM
jgi:glycerol uptake operon antiterminator